MPTYYVEDYDGKREDYAAAESKVVSESKTEDKVVAKKATAKKKS